MSTFETAHQPSRTAARAAAFLSAARMAWQGGIARLARRHRARHTAWLLQGLSGHEFKDIGLTRSDIGRIAQAGSARPSD
jgi:uncharacterized protein YjiS (DUF1127 family)